jgi:hypothetical protein
MLVERLAVGDSSRYLSLRGAISAPVWIIDDSNTSTLNDGDLATLDAEDRAFMSASAAAVWELEDKLGFGD